MEASMKTIDTPPASELADKEEVLRLLSEGKPVTDHELRRRVRERSERITKEIRRTHGLIDDERFQSLLDEES
jgi:predicted HTH transcriptional regulator